MNDIMKHEDGFTLLELLVIVAIIGILAGMASLSSDYIRRERVNSETKKILGDLQRARVDAMTQSPTATNPNMRGFGVRFAPAPTHSYTLFTFSDDGNWQYDSTAEELNGRERSMPSSIELEVHSPAGNVIIFDRYGLSRSASWAEMPQLAVVVKHQTTGYARCVNVTSNRIREGYWNGAACNEQ